MKQLFFHELRQNATRDFFKKYFYGEKDERSIFLEYCCRQKSFSTLVKMIKFHILKISTREPHLVRINFSLFLGLLLCTYSRYGWHHCCYDSTAQVLDFSEFFFSPTTFLVAISLAWKLPSSKDAISPHTSFTFSFKPYLFSPWTYKNRTIIIRTSFMAGTHFILPTRSILVTLKLN